MENRSLKDVMVTPATSLRQVVELINRNGLRGVFVCDEDQELLGIIMDSDIRRATLRNLDMNASVRTIMKTSPFVVRRDLSTEEKKRALIKSGKTLAPVVDEHRRVQGYLYLSDIIDDIYNNGQPADDGLLPPATILVVGGVGYIGSVLTDRLLRLGYRVRVLDLLLYGKDALSHFESDGQNFEFVRGDCRDEEVVRRMLAGADAVVHLAEIVGDPACRINREFTIGTNFAATQMIVEQSVKHGIKRFIFASSCSVYGQNDDEVHETSELNPVSLYARCKIESEKAIQSFDYSHFCPTILRLATVHGKSFRQRFDLVVNLLAIKALAEGNIKIFGGEQWRPFISVEDVCRGVIAVLQAEKRRVRNEVFNLGDSRENYQLFTIGERIQKHIPQVVVDVFENQQDTRNYRVSFEKIKRILKFTAQNTIDDSIQDFSMAYQHLQSYRDYMQQKYHNVLALREE